MPPLPSSRGRLGRESRQLARRQSSLRKPRSERLLPLRYPRCFVVNFQMRIRFCRVDFPRPLKQLFTPLLISCRAVFSVRLMLCAQTPVFDAPLILSQFAEENSKELGKNELQDSSLALGATATIALPVMPRIAPLNFNRDSI